MGPGSLKGIKIKSWEFIYASEMNCSPCSHNSGHCTCTNYESHILFPCDLEECHFSIEVSFFPVPTLAIWIEGKLAEINVLFSVLHRRLLAESEILKNSKLSTSKYQFGEA